MARLSISINRWRVRPSQKSDEARELNRQDPMQERIQAVLEKTARIWGLDDFGRLDETAGNFGALYVPEHVYARGTAASFHWIMAL